MKHITFRVKNKLGLHARLAVGLASISRETESKMLLQKENKIGNCREVFSLMNLNVQYGDTITFIVDGADEEETLKLVEKYCQEFL